MVDDTPKEKVSDFIGRIEEAKQTGEEWIETSPEIIQFYNRRGLNGGKYFIFQGIKVCEHGMKDKIVEEENTPISMRVFGKAEAPVNVEDKA